MSGLSLHAVIISSRQLPALEASVASCRDRIVSDASVTTKVSFVPYDAATRDDEGVSSATAIVDRVLALTEDRHVDRVFLNAGIYQLLPALSTPLDVSRRVARVNYESPVELAVTLLQERQHKRPLHIIVVASIISRGAHALVSSYAASKHALRGFFHTLATELSGDTVRIDVACPAGTATRLWENSGAPGVERHQLMSARRVAWLIVTGATGPYALFWETWIGQPIQLVWTATASYAPSLFQASALLFGWCRVQFWERDGTDVVDPLTLLRALFWKKK